MNILGNNFLISIAYKAGSPSKAAKIAQLYGCTREEIRAVRNAAVLLRDAGEEEFKRVFSPFELMDIPVNPCRTMTIKMRIKKTYEQRPLNNMEFNEVADFIQNQLAKYGIEIKIVRKKPNPFERSTLKIGKLE